MEYRTFGKLGFECSRFGLGCMRLPMVVQPDGTKNDADIDEPKAIELIRYAIDNGVTYVDTANGYHGGNSKIVLGKALRDGYRERVKLATKLPPWNTNAPADMQKLLDTNLEHLQTDYLDFYLVHALDKKNWEKMNGFGVREFFDKKIAEGKVRYPAFSFHGELADFKEIIDSYDWAMCQIQFNLLDTDYQAGLEGLRYAASKGVAVVVMEPLKGGKLANVPADVKAKWDSYPVKRSPQEWAFRWLANFPEVTLVLSGSSTLEQLKDSLEIFKSTGVNVMSPEELALVKEVKELYENKVKVGCTNCSYCMPCPAGVNIPRAFELYNNASVFDAYESNRKAYEKMVAKGSAADKCTACGSCEGVCPQTIQVIDKLKELHGYFCK